MTVVDFPIRKKEENKPLPPPTKTVLMCAVHGEVTNPLRLRGDDVYCASCLADFMEANNIGKTTREEVPL